MKPNLLKRFIGYYRPHIPLFLLDMICATAIAAIDIVFPLLTRYALQDLLPASMYAAFYRVVAAAFVCYVVRSLMTYVVTYLGHQLGVKMEACMRRDLFAHLQSLQHSFFDRSRTGFLMSRITNDLFEITELAHHGPEDVFISLLTFLGACAVMMTIEWRLALILIALVPVMIFFVMMNRKRLSNASKKVKEGIAVINAGIESSISGVRVAKAFTNEEYEIRKFEKGNGVFVNSKRGYLKVMAVFTGGLDFFNGFLQVVVLGAGGLLIMKGAMDIVALLTFSLYVSAFVQPLRRIGNFSETFTMGMAGFSRFSELMSTAPDIVDSPGAKALSGVKGEIEFRDVSFSYDDDVSVLEHVNLKIKAGRSLALVGPSGGGKTTLCHLIPRFYETSGGVITIDGFDIRNVTLKSLRENIGIVQQDVFLFADTIKENIRYGRITASDEEVVEAARAAKIHDEIMSMPDGYDTLVGERGVLLSGGQKQRISIARIFLKNPPILILDEATSALDSATEAKITEAFDKLSIGRTTLVIAHRLSTVRDADEIIVIDDEGIKERGTHAELLELNGEYAHLYASQFKNGA
ncbi:MAG: putative multidrug export ATP-binding/permease protein [Firmicutes bacterium ADurb.Bin182]|nr:MAG: putative multidrug export ATP-binding/permease protein [Firmicutes bacterium ADurb.Bin182]